MKKQVCLAVVAFLVFSSIGLFAQGSAESSVRGNLSGTVVDTSGAVVAGAKVTITGPTGTKADTTNQDGQFLFPLLSPGFYSLKVEKGSFKTADVKGVEVVTGKTSNVRVGMVAGQQTEVVEVTSSAVTVDVTSTAVAANLTDTFYQSVPVARGVTGLFYASPGVTSGGGTGASNPSIAGGTGLENNYVADGVSLTDGGFGGIGVYSRLYGSLSTGINLSFVKEVQVKTGGFEAQYGKSTGGIVQIVTKSGGNDLHGVIGGYFAPSSFEATRKFSDDFQNGSTQQRFNLQGKIQHQANYDLDAEVGGHVPGLKNKLFFFGSFNPQWNTDNAQFAQFRNASDCGISPGLVPPCAGATPTQTFLGTRDLSQHVYSYAGKLTWKATENHQLEASLFGDPTYGNNNPNGAGGLGTANVNAVDKLQFGTRNFVARYNGAMTPSWLVNASWTWGHNNLKDTPADPSVYQIVDLTQRNSCGAPFFDATCASTDTPVRGSFTRQGLGYFENTHGDTYGLSIDTTKSYRFLGEHSTTFGYRFDRSHYDGTKQRTGAGFQAPDVGGDAYGPLTEAAYGLTPGDPQSDGVFQQLISNPVNAAGQLRASGAQCGIAEIYIPG